MAKKAMKKVAVVEQRVYELSKADDFLAWGPTRLHSSILPFLETGELPPLRFHGAPVFEDQDAETIVNKKGVLCYLLDGEVVDEDHVCGVLLLPPKKGIFSKYSHLLLIDADVDDSDNYSPSLTYLGEKGFPMVSFLCMQQMLGDISDKALLRKLTSGVLELLDFAPECRKDLTKEEKKELNKQKKELNKAGKVFRPILKPPELGFSLMATSATSLDWQWHRSGSTLFKMQDHYYLFGQDEGSYFGVELCEPVKNLAEAYRSLVPTKLRKIIGLLRQGEWFMVPVKEKDVPKSEDCALLGFCPDAIYLPLEQGGKRHCLSTNDLRVGRDGVVYALNPSLEHQDHQNLFAEGWHTFQHNTALKSVSQEGVD